MQIYFGTKVISQEGEEVGTVGCVVLDVARQEVTHIVIAKGGLFAQNWIVPLNMVQEATADRLLLYVAAAALQQVPQEVAPGLPMVVWEEEAGQAELAAGAGAPPPAVIPQPTPPESRAMTVRKQYLPLDKGSLVVAIDGQLGPLAAVKLDLYDDRLTSIVMEQGAAVSRPLDVPVEWIAALSRDTIRLATTVDQVTKLMPPEAGPYLSEEGERGGGIG